MSAVKNQRPRPVPFIGRLKIIWQYNRTESYVREYDDLDVPEIFDAIIAVGGELVYNGSSASMSNPITGPTNFLENLDPGDGRTVFRQAGDNNFVGSFLTSPLTSPQEVSTTAFSYRHDFERNEDEGEWWDEGEEITGAFGGGNIEIYRQQLELTFDLAIILEGTTTRTFPPPEPPEEQEPPIIEPFAYNFPAWSGTVTINTNNPFGTFPVELDRAVKAYWDESIVTGEESLAMSVIISPWS